MSQRISILRFALCGSWWHRTDRHLPPLFAEVIGYWPDLHRPASMNVAVSCWIDAKGAWREPSEGVNELEPPAYWRAMPSLPLRYRLRSIAWMLSWRWVPA
jgi:hypothetical protein